MTRNILNACLSVAVSASPILAQSVALGPVVDPSTGNRYYRLTPNLWLASRTVALAMGGDLVTIGSAAENEFVRSAVASVGNSFICYTGMNDTIVEGAFIWCSGQPVTYTNWALGEPNNGGGNEDHATIQPITGQWIDVAGTILTLPAIVEVSGPIRVPTERPTIAAAIEAAINGSVILVSPGVHIGAINFSGKTITIRSTHGPLVTTIDAQGASSAVSFAAGSGEGTLLEGFTITGGNATTGGGVQVQNSSPTIRGCIIRENSATSGGGAHAFRGTTTFVDCVIAANTATSGGALSLFNSTGVRLVNCTIVGNTAVGSTAFDNGGGTLTGINCIVRGTGSGAAAFAHSNVIGYAGPGNITSDPMLGADFRLLPGSPCIDAGSNPMRITFAPAHLFVDLFGQDRFNDDPGTPNTGEIGPSSPIDMGAAEFQGTSLTCNVDFNGDRNIDPDDLGDFINAFFGGCP